MGAYVSHKYLKSFADAAAHVRYIGFREREDKSESLGLFSENEDSANAEKFIKTLNDKRFSHPDVANLHTVLFSMSGDEWNRSGFEPGDYQRMIRHVMKEFEIKNGYRLDWVAAEHRNPDHPHCHVAIRASYKDRDGIEHRLKITNEDRKFLREQFQRTKEMVRPFDPPPRSISYQQQRDKNRNPLLDLGSSFINNLFYQIDRELAQEEWERDLARKKAQNQDRGR